MSTGSKPPEKPALPWLAYSPLVQQMLARTSATPTKSTGSTPTAPKTRRRRQRRARRVVRVEERLARFVPASEAERLLVELLRVQVVAEATSAAKRLRKDLRELVDAYVGALDEAVPHGARVRNTRRRMWSLELRLRVALRRIAALGGPRVPRRPGRPSRPNTLGTLVNLLVDHEPGQLSERSRASQVRQQLMILRDDVGGRTGVLWTWKITIENVRSVLRHGTK